MPRQSPRSRRPAHARTVDPTIAGSFPPTGSLHCLDLSCSANATLFTLWLVTWLMVWQRSQRNTS